ncbi:MAG TPA: hypothetical protein PLE57_00915 [Methanoregulaceae archaeon]|nr:hypothetical protein [Methanoregulaceae archaeon]
MRKNSSGDRSKKYLIQSIGIVVIGIPLFVAGDSICTLTLSP